MADINKIFADLAQWQRVQEEAAAAVEALKDEVKKIMTESGNYTIIGNEHRAAWADVTQSKVDTKQLKEQYPAIAEALTVSSTYKRFTFK